MTSTLLNVHIGHHLLELKLEIAAMRRRHVAAAGRKYRADGAQLIDDDDSTIVARPTIAQAPLVIEQSSSKRRHEAICKASWMEWGGGRGPRLPCSG